MTEMNGWELDAPQDHLLDDSAELRRFLEDYPLAAVNQERNLLVILRKCDGGLNCPPQGAAFEWQVYVVFVGGWSRYPLPKLEYKSVDIQGREIEISTDEVQVKTNPAELQKLFNVAPEDCLEVFLGLANELPAPKAPILTKNLQSEVLGTMTQADFDDWWQGHDLKVPFFENQELPVIFRDLNPDQEPDFLEQADNALRSFLDKGPAERDGYSQLVRKNCDDFIEAVGVDEWNQEMASIQNDSEIWQFVEPNTIYLSRRGHDKDPAVYLEIACGCDWEEEHGLILVFRRGQHLTRVSQHDGHLTEADAYAIPEEQDALLWAALQAE